MQRLDDKNAPTMKEDGEHFIKRLSVSNRDVNLLLNFGKIYKQNWGQKST